MKKSLLFAAFAAIAIFSASCEKSDPVIKTSGVKTSDVICDITLDKTFNNLLAVSYDAQALDVIVKTNVPVISYADAEYASGHGFQFTLAKDASPDQTGNVPYVFHSGGNSDYTVDCGFKLIQTMWNKEQAGYADFWTDYTNYGLIETDVNFRVRGSKGERIIDFDDKKNWSAGSNYYLTGVVTGLSNVSESTKDFETLPIYKPFFEKIGFQQTATSYTAQECILTVVTEKDTLNLQIYGKKRDNELARLLDNVKIGNAIEFPVWVKDKASLKERKVEPVKVSAVLKVDVPKWYTEADKVSNEYDLDVN